MPRAKSKGSSFIPHPSSLTMDEYLIPLVLIAIVFFAAFEQTISGFGFSLITMPLVSLVLGIQTAAPLVAVTALTLYVVNFARHREAVVVPEVLRLGIPLVFGIPIGIWLLNNVNEAVIKML
ncbi:MAG: sulfite exporter TauE/SafE family protein, partial [Chloroflexota bacterium]